MLFINAEENWAFSKLHYALNSKQLYDVRAVMTKLLDVPKSEFKASVRKFVQTLPKDLQRLAKAEQKRKDHRILETKKRLKGLSSQAQKVYGDLEELRLNQTLSVHETARNVRQILHGTDANVVREMKRADLFGVNDDRDFVFDL